MWNNNSAHNGTLGFASYQCALTSTHTPWSAKAGHPRLWHRKSKQDVGPRPSPRTAGTVNVLAGWYQFWLLAPALSERRGFHLDNLMFL
jgi:hypothetical protein